MSATFDINQDELIKFTKKLSKLHKSALPLAIRGTLNDVAFLAKTEVPSVFNKNFTVRKKNFIRSHTGVKKCSNTFDVNQMISMVGILKGKSEAGDNLMKQELGGTIKDREFIPLKDARVSKNPNKLISKRNYIANIRGKRATKSYQNNDFRRAAIKAGKGGSVIYNDLLIRIDAINKSSRSGLFIKSTAIYNYKSNRMVSIKPKPFISISAKKASMQIPNLYRKNAEFRIKKAMKL